MMLALRFAALYERAPIVVLAFCALLLVAVVVVDLAIVFGAGR